MKYSKNNSKNNGIISVNLYFTSLLKTHLTLSSLIQYDFTVKMSQSLHVAKSFSISISFLHSGHLYFTLSDFELTKMILPFLIMF